jgi:acetylornithine deacetylase
MLHVFYKLCAAEQSYNLIFLASAEEEVSGKDGIEAVLPMLPPISCAIIGEPTGMHPAIAEKGLMVLDCVARGKAGHAAREEGVNAIYEALNDIEWFRTHQMEKVSPLLGAVKMSVTGIGAGTQHNVVPDECRFMVDVRVNECYKNEELLAEIRKAVKCEVTPRSTHLNSSAIDAEHPAVKRLIDIGKVPFGSPTMSNQAVMPFATLKLGPGDSARSHTADEYIMLDEIREAIDLYEKVLDNLIIKK